MRLSRRLLCSLSKQASYHYITTPIFYVNAKPHLGHVYSAVIADSLARFHRLRDPSIKVHFVSGTDEHGNKVNDAADSAQMSTQSFCDKVSQTFQDVFRHAHIHPDVFMRTTSIEHKKAVETLWMTLLDRGYIYLGHHEGWYCRSEECFVASSQVVQLENGDVVTRESSKSVEWLSEPNYKFKLSYFSDMIRDWIEQDPCPIQPVSFKKELLSLFDKGLQDLSVSRLKASVSWGIPVPNDTKHTIYVWLDALCNYLTASGYPDVSMLWPPTKQIIGKDILRFHAIYWPAFLLAAGLPLPKSIIVHSHWIIDGGKMSKSIGNVICPRQLSTDFGHPDAMRYFLLRHSSIEHDSSFNLNQAALLLNRDLADQFGNLYSRALALLEPDTDEEVFKTCLDPLVPSQELNRALISLPSQVEESFSSVKFNIGLQQILDVIAVANHWFSSERPWAAQTRKDRLKVVVSAINICRIAAILLQPVIPNLSDSILNHMRIPIDYRSYDHLFMWKGPGPLSKKFAFFQRLPIKANCSVTERNAI